MIPIYFCILFYISGVLAINYNFPKPIDLSHTLDGETITWKKETPFRFTNRVAQNLSDTTFYAANDFCVPEHAGTHLDAPYHFNEKGMKVGDIPLDFLISPGIIVNVSDLVEKYGTDFLLLPEHLESWEKQNGKIPTNIIMLINFGWSWKYSNRSLYFGASSQPYSFPGISESAAQWIVKLGKVRGIGVDTPSLDYGKSETFIVHQILNKAGLFGLENVNLNNMILPARGFDLIVLPMKIKEGSGAPVRIVAV